MADPGLRVLVQGDLPAEQLALISAAVRAAVLRELAAAGLAAALTEKPIDDNLHDVTGQVSSDDEPGVGAAILAELGLLSGIQIGGIVGTIGAVGGLAGVAGTSVTVPTSGSSPSDPPASQPAGSAQERDTR
jgi:hypothetical protein